MIGVFDTTPDWQVTLNLANRSEDSAVLPLLQKALAQAGEEPEALQSVYERLSRAWAELGDRQQALSALEKAGNLLRQRVGTNDPVWSRHFLLGADVDPEGAPEWLNRAFQIVRKYKGRLHPDHVHSMNRHQG